MSFTLSKLVNPPTVFLAKRSELRDRFDPEMVLFRRKANEFKYPPAKLKGFFSEPPQYGAGERGLKREADEQPRYIRITDIDEYGILTEELGATAAAVEPRYILGEDDFLIARSGNTVGKSYLHKPAHAPAICFFAGYLIRFRFRRDEILPDYAFAFTQLPYYKEWVRAVQRAAGQPNINAQEYSNLEIPTAPIPVQKKVISLLNNAYTAKRHRDEDARKLLLGIDDVLLEELGIPRKPEPPNTLKSRIFKTQFSELTGQRWDPLYHQADVFQFVRDTKCDLKRLSSQVEYFITGFPAGRGDQVDEDDGGVIQIRPTNLTDDRELVFRRNVYIAAQELKTRTGDVLKRREVLFNNTNSQEQVGKTVWFDMDGDYFSSNHITRIGTKSAELNPQYLAAVLNLYQRRKVFFKLCTNWNNQSGVGSDILQRMPIPLPKPTRQTEIVKRLEAIRCKATKLREQARTDLEKAKRDIEAMILGDPVSASATQYDLA